MWYLTSFPNQEVAFSKYKTHNGLKILREQMLTVRACSHYAAAKSLQSCPTLCDPIDGSPPGSSIPGILQARMLKWVAISFSNACTHAKSLQSCPTLCYLWTAAHQASLSMRFSGQEYWRGLPFPSPVVSIIPYKKNHRTWNVELKILEFMP